MFYSIPLKKWIFGPKMAKFGPKLAFSAKYWHFWPNIGNFGPFGPMPGQKPMQTRCLGGFSVMLVPKLLLTPKKSGFLAQKLPIWPKIGI